MTNGDYEYPELMHFWDEAEATRPPLTSTPKPQAPPSASGKTPPASSDKSGADGGSSLPGGESIPDIKLKPLKTHVSVDYCLTQLDRLMRDHAEIQEDPEWYTTHLQMAQLWLQTAQALMDRELQEQQARMDVGLKRQQMRHEEELHKQSVTQNDQKHTQDMSQKDVLHKQGMAQKDVLHKQDVQTKDGMNKMAMAKQKTMHSMDISARKDHLTQQKQAMRSKLAAKPAKSPSANNPRKDDSK